MKFDVSIHRVIWPLDCNKTKMSQFRKKCRSQHQTTPLPNFRKYLPLFVLFLFHYVHVFPLSFLSHKSDLIPMLFVQSCSPPSLSLSLPLFCLSLPLIAFHLHPSVTLSLSRLTLFSSCSLRYVFI